MFTDPDTMIQLASVRYEGVFREAAMDSLAAQMPDSRTVGFNVRSKLASALYSLAIRVQPAPSTHLRTT